MISVLREANQQISPKLLELADPSKMGDFKGKGGGGRNMNKPRQNNFGQGGGPQNMQRFDPQIPPPQFNNYYAQQRQY